MYIYTVYFSIKSEVSDTVVLASGSNFSSSLKDRISDRLGSGFSERFDRIVRIRTTNNMCIAYFFIFANFQVGFVFLSGVGSEPSLTQHPDPESVKLWIRIRYTAFAFPTGKQRPFHRMLAPGI